MQNITPDAFERLQDERHRAEQKYDELDMKLTKLAKDIMVLEGAQEELAAARKLWSENPTYDNHIDYASSEGAFRGYATVVLTCFRAHFGDYL